MKENKTSTILTLIAVLALMLSSSSVFAQNYTDSMKKFAEEIKNDKKTLILANMVLNEEQKDKFIPIYEEYQAELSKINERIVSLIQSYASAYNSNAVTDNVASQLLSEMNSIESREAEIQGEISKKLLTVLPAIKVTKYIQMENKIRAVLNYELAAQIPLVK